MTRRQKADTVAGMIEAAQAVAAGEIQPPDHIQLRERDWPFWGDVTRARARKEWTETDLAAAANLARTLADIEEQYRLIEEEGDVLTNERGTRVANPRVAMLETLSRRSVSIIRMLQIQPAVTGQGAAKAGARNAERAAREVANEVKAEDSLLA